MRTIWLGLSVWGALAVLACAPKPARADPPIWRVHGARGEVTLFGSVHLLAQDTRWTSRALQTDLSRADEVWFEIPVDPSAQAQAGKLAVARGLLPTGQTLSAQLSPTGQARLVHLCKVLGLDPLVLEHFQPWFAELSLTLLYLQAHGARSDLGIEEVLAREAPASARREALETIEQQIGFLADLSPPLQIASLEETLEQIERDPGAFDRLSAAWAHGDTALIEREAIAPMERDTPAVYARLLVDRNLRWTRRIEAMLGQSHRVVIVVGVGHLVGRDSVPSLLRRDGYRVEGPN